MPEQSTQNALLDEAIAAAKGGDRIKAKDKLTRFLRYDQKNEHAWLWMSSVVESDRERIFCLNNALKLNPNNKTAKRGLALLGALPPEMRADLDIEVIGVDLKADASSASPAQRKRGGFTIRRSRRLETTAIVVLALVVIAGFVIFGFNAFGLGKRITSIGITPSATPLPPTATHTPTPTPVPPTPTELAPATPMAGAGQTPIAIFLGLPEFTPTPEPFTLPFSHVEAYGRGERLYKEGNYDAALQEFKDAASQDRESYAAHYYLGLIYLQKKQYNNAFNSFSSAIKINSAFGPAYVGRGQATFGGGGNPLGDYDKAKNAEPDWIEPYIQSAIFYASRRNTDAAITQLETARSFAPTNVIVHWHLAEQYLAAGRTEDARATLNAGFDVDPTVLDLYRVQTLLLIVDKDYQTALNKINIYLSYRPADPEGWALQGKVFLGLGDAESAVTSLNRAIELKPDDPSEALIARGTAQLVLGNSDTAGDDFDKALTSRFTTSNLLLIGQAYYNVGDYENALTKFSRAYQSDKTGFDTNYWLGAAQVGAGSYGDAIESLDEALSKADTDLKKFDCYYQRGKAHKGLDERDKAIDDLREALLLNVADRAQEQEDAALLLSQLGGPKVSATHTPTPQP
ncbi:MAG: tetratricopeptide repeat protein [Chloroflexota bacterium]